MLKQLSKMRFRVCLVLCAPLPRPPSVSSDSQGGGGNKAATPKQSSERHIPVAAYYSVQVCRIALPAPVILPIHTNVLTDYPASEAESTSTVRPWPTRSRVGTPLQCIFVRTVIERVDASKFQWALCRDRPDGTVDERISPLDFDFDVQDRLVRVNVRAISVACAHKSCVFDGITSGADLFDLILLMRVCMIAREGSNWPSSTC